MLEQLRRDLERCDAEIARAELEVMKSVEPGGAWLGLHDWSWERRIIAAQLESLVRTA